MTAAGGHLTHWYAINVGSPMIAAAHRQANGVWEVHGVE